MANRAESSGQMRDMLTTLSDDGTVPPTAVRESITTPEPVKGSDSGSAASAGARQTPAGEAATALSPTDPHRDSDEGQPYLDDTNPYGRSIPNQQDRPMGGVGNEGEADPALMREREQPGESAAHPLKQSLQEDPFAGDPGAS